jgi:hypothetical protein
MLIDGKCHCGNIAFVLDWPGVSPEIVARACGCTFCTKHGGVWTSHPDAKLSVAVAQKDAVSSYVFGTKTATFHVCTRCGAVPVVTSEIADQLYAVVNVNTFDHFDFAGLRRQAMDFAGEEQQLRLVRRRKNWISNVRFREGAA